MTKSSLELIADLEKEISQVLNDELLVDILPNFSLQEIDTLIAVEQGQAFNIRIKREPLESIDLIVSQSHTVKDIKRHVQLKLEKMNANSTNKKSISWKFIWRTYCLSFGNQKLLQDTAVVSQLGIKQNSTLTFSRIPHQKGNHRKAWQWYKH
ncbi:hypothetical protein G6F56_008083 [Rhizopus delemar]|nr:hypothetical protein G6F56_008083 [Rhizopus delemar]